MAENTEILFTIKVDTSEAAKLGNMNAQLDALRASYKKIAEEQGKNSEAATQAALQVKRMADETRTYEREVLNANKANEKGKNTLAGLRAETAKLNAEREKVEIGSKKYKELTKELENNRNAINRADEAAGRFNGNVGNYAGGIQNAFKAMGFDISGVTNAISSASENLTKMGTMAKTAFSGASQGAFSLKAALISSGIGAIIVAIGVAFASVTSAIKSSEEASDSWDRSMAAMSGSSNIFMNAFKKLGESITNDIETITIIFAMFSKNARDAIKIASDMDLLVDKKLELDVRVANRESRIAELKNRTREKDKYDFNQRKSALLEIQYIEEEKLKDKLKIFDEETRLLRLKSQLDGKQSEEEKIMLSKRIVERKNMETESALSLKRIKGETATYLAEENKANEEDNQKKKELAQKRIEQLQKEAAIRLEIEEQLRVNANTIRENAIKDLDLYFDKQKAIRESKDVRAKYMQAGQEQEVADDPELQYAIQVMDAQMQFSDQMNDYQYEQYKSYLRNKLLSEKEYSDAVLKMDKARTQAQMNNAAALFNSMGQIFSAFGSSSKGMALAQVSFSMAEAIVNLLKVAEANPLNAVTFGAAGIAQYLSGIARIIGVGNQAYGIINSQGFYGGGYTGDGGKYQPAGIVHRGEFVFSKEATSAIGVNNLSSIHSQFKGYADGGAVGIPSFSIPDFSNPQFNQMKSIIDGITSIPVTVLEKDITLTQKRVDVMNKAGDLF